MASIRTTSQILPGSQYEQDKKKGFQGTGSTQTAVSQSTNSEPRREMSLQQLKAEAMSIAAVALGHIPIPNIEDHGHKVVRLSRIFEQELMTAKRAN